MPSYTTRYHRYIYQIQILICGKLAVGGNRTTPRNNPDLPAFTKEGIIIILFKEDGVDAVRTCVGNHLSFEFSSFFQDREKVYSESASIRAKYNTTKMGEVDGFHSVDEIEENPRIVLFVFE